MNLIKAIDAILNIVHAFQIIVQHKFLVTGLMKTMRVNEKPEQLGNISTTTYVDH